MQELSCVQECLSCPDCYKIVMCPDDSKIGKERYRELEGEPYNALTLQY
jgi:hypothetical protein